MNLIEKINRFEETSQSVECFNLIFENCPLVSFSESAYVEIGSPGDTDTRRYVTVGNKTFLHDFSYKERTLGDELYEELLEERRAERTQKVNQKRRRAELGKPEKPELDKPGDNLVLSVKELELLNAGQYLLLQYLRGCRSNYVTLTNVGAHLGLSRKTIKKDLQHLTQCGILEVEEVKRVNALKITIEENWL